MRTAYEAVNENCRVFIAYGETPAKALKNAARLLKNNKVDWWSASVVNYLDDENIFYITIYV
jgi:hypothetical protein